MDALSSRWKTAVPDSRSSHWKTAVIDSLSSRWKTAVIDSLSSRWPFSWQLCSLEQWMPKESEYPEVPKAAALLPPLRHKTDSI